MNKFQIFIRPVKWTFNGKTNQHFNLEQKLASKFRPFHRLKINVLRAELIKKGSHDIVVGNDIKLNLCSKQTEIQRQCQMIITRA